MANTNRNKLVLKRWLDIILMTSVASLSTVYLDHAIKGVAGWLQEIGSGWNPYFILAVYLIIPLSMVALLNTIGSFRFKDFNIINSFANPPTWYAAILGVCLYPFLSFYLGRSSYQDHLPFYTIFIFVFFMATWTIIDSGSKLMKYLFTLCYLNSSKQKTSIRNSTFDFKRFTEWLDKEEPVYEIRYDFFNSNSSGRRLARALNKKPRKNISLIGPYGSGKTTILNLTQKELEVDKSKIIISVSAWGYEDKKFTSYILEHAVKEIAKHTDCISLSFVPLSFQNIFLNNSWGPLDFLKFLFAFETAEELIQDR